MKENNKPLGTARLVTTPGAVILPGKTVISWSDWIAEKFVVVRKKSRREVVQEEQIRLGI